MKAILLITCTILFVGYQPPQKQPSNTHKINETQKIRETVTQLFVHTDHRNWNNVAAQFAPKVNLDYSSMTGNPTAQVSPTDIISAWKTVLPGFTHTHHQLGNFIIKNNGDKAHVFCYGTATHFIKDDNGSVWTVVGSYDFDVEKIDQDWKITSMIFNYKYQNGNDKLLEKAIENVKSN